MNLNAVAKTARLALLFLAAASAYSRAGAIAFGSQVFTPSNDNADGKATVVGNDLVITGGNNGSGAEGSTDVVAVAAAGGAVTFQYFFSTLDIDPGTGDIWDSAGYLLDGLFYPFSPLLAPGFTPAMFSVLSGQTFGFRVATLDNIGEPGILTISNLEMGDPAGVPEPGLAWLVAGGGLLCAAFHSRRPYRLRPRVRALGSAVLAMIMAGAAGAQTTQITYKGGLATGKLALTYVGDANPSTVARLSAMSSRFAVASQESTKAAPEYTEIPRFTRPVVQTMLLATPSTLGPVLTPGLSVVDSVGDFSFDGLTNGQQRLANNGNQLSFEPPNPEIAVGKQYILAGVNNGIQVYSRSTGAPLLTKVISTNELFGVSPSFDRTTNTYGVFPTDMRVFYDHDIDRWFVMQRAQGRRADGVWLGNSRLFLAVSQTGDPTGKYNVYVRDTTYDGSPYCPCISDYPEIAADKYAINISFDLYSFPYNYAYAGARILSVSKAGLAAGASSPVAWEFTLKDQTHFEASIKPAATPPGASYFIASGGVQYLLSTNFRQSSDNRFALWALINTASLATTPDLTLIQKLIPGVAYTRPDNAIQKPGPNPLGSHPLEYYPPRPLALIDGGFDCRLLSLTYTGGRLYTTLATRAYDEAGTKVVGGAYAILSPTYRAGVIAAPVLREGRLVVKNNHVLRPAVAVNPDGKGAIVYTLAGPDHYPSAAFTPIETFSTGTTARRAAIGAAPEDGFTGYDSVSWPQIGIARWGDYSGAVATDDGSIWMVGQYIPDLLRYRTNENWYAHWGTRIIRYIP